MNCTDILMTPHQGNKIIFHFSQQLPRIHQGPLKMHLRLKKSGDMYGMTSIRSHQLEDNCFSDGRMVVFFDPEILRPIAALQQTF